MTAIKRVFFFIILIIPSLAYGDWATDFFSSRSSYTVPSDLQSQGGYTYQGGGWTWSGGSNATLQAFNVTAPSVTAGCSGIDLNLGAFQFMDEDQLVEFLEALLAAAPGYAFELAMQILCPSCLDIMNTLKQMANVLNSLQLDACGTLNLVGSFVEDAASNYVNNNIGTGKENSFNNAMSKFNSTLKQLNEYIDKAFSCATGNGCPKKMYKAEQTLQELVVETMPSTIVSNVKNLYDVASDSELAAFFGSFLGDVMIVDTDEDNSSTKDNNTEGVSKKWIGLDPTHNNPRALVYQLTYGTSDIPANISTSMSSVYETTEIEVPVLNSGSSQPFGGYETLTIQTTQGQANSYLDLLSTSFSGRGTPLETDTLVFLASFKTPVYKILNLYSVDDTALNHFIESFRVLAGAQMTYELTSALATSVRGALVNINSQIAAGDVGFVVEFKQKTQDIAKNMSAMQEAASEMYVEAYDQFVTKMQDNDYLQRLQKLQRAMMARHPVAGQSLFTTTLGN